MGGVDVVDEGREQERRGATLVRVHDDPLDMQCMFHVSNILNPS